MKHRDETTASHKILGAATGLATFLFLLGFGLLLCCAPFTTHFLASVTVDVDRSPYTHDQLVESSDALRTLTIDGPNHIDSSGRTAEQNLYQLIGTDALSLDDATLAKYGVNVTKTRALATNEEVGRAVSEVSDVLGLPADALQHLLDVNAVTSWALPLFEIATVIALVLGFVLFRVNKSVFSNTLKASAAALIVLFVLLGIGGCLNFEGLFSTFHHILFPQGNWTFYIDSLLICSLPTAFWMAMAVIWLVCTLAACIICLLIATIAGKRPAQR